MSQEDEIILAIKQGDQSKVASLLAGDPSLATTRTAQGLSAALLSAYYQHPAIAMMLASVRTHLDIFEACAIGLVEAARDLLDESPELAHAWAPDGFQPLGLAAFFGHDEIAALLLERGAPLDTASRNRLAVAPLNSAAAGGRHTVAHLLLEHGADPNFVQGEGFTPLHAAADNGDLEMIQMLLDFGADSSLLTTDGRSAVQLALEKGYREAAEMLER